MLIKTLLQLALIAVLPVIFSVVIYFIEKTRLVKKIPYALNQIMVGILFGGLAVLGTEFGVDIGGAVMNARDAAPICAGLLFGAPAGIIAGVIGGVERWFAVLCLHATGVLPIYGSCGCVCGASSKVYV